MLTQLVTSQSYQLDYIGSIALSSKLTRVSKFIRLNSPTFIGSKVMEDPQ